MAFASHKNSLEGSANCALHLSLSLLLGSKLHESLTCLTHTNPVRRKRPIMSLLLGYSLGLLNQTWIFWLYLSICKTMFSPKNNSLGSSAIVNVLGQNWFRTLSGSLGQIRLGALKDPKGYAEGSTKVPRKVPPRFHAAEWSLIGFHLKIHRCCWGYSLGLFFKSIWEWYCWWTKYKLIWRIYENISFFIGFQWIS